MAKGLGTFIVGFVTGVTTAILLKKLSDQNEDPVEALAESITKKLDMLEQKTNIERLEKLEAAHS